MVNERTRLKRNAEARYAINIFALYCRARKSHYASLQEHFLEQLHEVGFDVRDNSDGTWGLVKKEA